MSDAALNHVMYELKKARDERDAAKHERDEARSKASEYHRRAQKAEAVAAKSFETQASGGANVGRALARVAAEHYKSEADRLREALRECVHHIDHQFGEPPNRLAADVLTKAREALGEA